MSALHSFKMFNLISLVAATLAGCASPEAPMSADDAEYPILATQPDSKDKRPATTRLDALSRYFEEWKGTPYRWGGASKKGIDCSAFTQNAYAQLFSHSLPRTTRQQLNQGSKVSMSTADQGDLVFFKTGARLYHVGIYLGEKQFMHASASKGVVISRIDNPYWSARLLQIRRYPLN